MAALGAAIRVQRQGPNPQGEEFTHSLHCTGRAAILCNYGRAEPKVTLKGTGFSPFIHAQNECGLLPLGDSLFKPPLTPFQCTMIGTEALWSSHASVSVPLPPPPSVIVYTRFSTMAAGLLIVIGTLPRSLLLS